MTRYHASTFEPTGKYYRLEARTLCHLPNPTIVLAVPGTIRVGWLKRLKSVIRVWSHPAVDVEGVLMPTTRVPEYEQFYRLTDVHQAMREFVLAINRPTVVERLTLLNM